VSNWASADILKFATEGFTSAAMAKVGTSALESKKLGYLSTATSSWLTRTSCCSSPAHKPSRCSTAVIGRR
jgi:hypothetical protein